MVRRVVTGEDTDGAAAVRQDGPVEFSIVAGAFKFAQLWGGDATPKFPHAGAEPVNLDLMPGPGGYRFVLMRIEPGQSTDPEETERALFAQSGVDQAEGGEAGMHRTDTVDLGVVVSGLVAMEMADGTVVELGRGDVFIQNGTYHKWSNPGPEPCEVVVAMIGGHPRT